MSSKTKPTRENIVHISESEAGNDSYQNVLLLNADTDRSLDDHDDYDHCKEYDSIGTSRLRANTNELNTYKNRRDRSYSRNSNNNKNVGSPLKRTKAATDHRSSSRRIDDQASPNKRIKMPATNENKPRSIRGFDLSRSPKRSTSMCEPAIPSLEKKIAACASTPKSERRHNPVVSKVAADRQNSSTSSLAAVERNMSTNWGDILEELEEQSRELNEYVEKVSVKFKLDKDVLLTQLETDAERLRKRQKQINFGKVTAEYQRYVVEVTRRNRQPYHPRTPNKFRQCCRRKFDGAIRQWRKHLHAWNANPEGVKDYKHSIEDGDLTEDFGNAISYIVDDYDLLDDDDIAQPLKDEEPTKKNTTK
jgi:hypothetical protein